MISPERAVDGINDTFGSHDGSRSLHAKGILCRGTFSASPEAGRLTSAGHMQGEPVPVTVRFSNGSGNPHHSDRAPDVRGMAVKFYLPDGSKTDISAQTSPRFPVRTPDAFIALVRANKPGLGRLWKLPLFLATHPEAVPALRAGASALKAPPSYAARRYYAVHAFKWVDAEGGERFVRYTWLPEDGGDSEGPDDRGPDYLQEEMRDRLGRGPVRFTLQLQIAAGGDKVDDPTSVWPAERETVDAGTLEVTGLDTSRERDGDVLVFDPTRVTDGIELSDDPILKFRPRAYSVSVDRRS